MEDKTVQITMRIAEASRDQLVLEFEKFNKENKLKLSFNQFLVYLLENAISEK